MQRAPPTNRHSPKPCLSTPRGPGDPFGTRQSGSRGGLSGLCLQELRRHPPLMEHARAAAAEVLSSQQLTPQVKAALVAYGFWLADDGAGAGSTSTPAGGEGGGGGKGAGKSGVSGV
jgi:hypothetical protein